MKPRKQTKCHLAGMIIVVLVLAMTGSVQAIDVGVGTSESKDALTAGTEAAQKAKAALGDRRAKLVLVYNGGEFYDDCKEVLKGVTSAFDSSIVYGCNGYAPLTGDSSQGTVGVLALGGQVDVALAIAKTSGKDDDHACGARIGTALKKPSSAKAAGRVLLLFGDCHVPRNDTVAKGVSSVLGEAFPIVGGAAQRGRIYVEGKPVEKSNLGILLSGDFKCRLSLLQDNSPEGLITSARDALQNTIGTSQAKTALVLVFDCGGRRGMMLKNGNFPKELEVMKQVAGDAPIFGFYGSGEIGCPENGSTACGVGHHISACAIVVE